MPINPTPREAAYQHAMFWKGEYDAAVAELEETKGYLKHRTEQRDEAEAEFWRLRAELARAEGDKRRMEKALLRAEEFITNGVAFGYIRMPDPETLDPAKEVLPMIQAALAAPTAADPDKED